MLTRPALLSRVVVLLGSIVAAASPCMAAEPAKVEPLAGTQPLTWEGDLSLKMVDDLHLFADRLTAESIERRARHWKRDFSSRETYEKSVEPNRRRLAKYLGVRFDRNLSIGGETLHGMFAPEHEPSEDRREKAVRWPVFGEHHAAALMEVPRNGHPQANVIVLYDHDFIIDAKAVGDRSAGQELAGRFHDANCRTWTMAIADRGTRHAAVANGERPTNQTHREFIYRQAFEMGRHLIGYEIERVLTLVDRLAWRYPEAKIAIVGSGDAGRIALLAVAIDTRIDVACVDGAFGSQQRMWEDPIDRNIWGFLDEFGDAEAASLIVPRKLLIDTATHSKYVIQPVPKGLKETAAPGTLRKPSPDEVKDEIKRLGTLIPKLDEWNCLTVNDGGDVNAIMLRFASELGLTLPPKSTTAYSYRNDEHQLFAAYNDRLVPELIAHTQALVNESEYVRQSFWKNADRKSRDPAKWEATLKPYRDHLYDEVLGRFDLPKLPPNARTRKIYDTPKYVGYEVVLDVFGAKPGDGNLSAGGSDVWAFGVLLVPKDLKPGKNGR